MAATLRPIGLSDLEQLWRLDQDPEVMRHITGGQPSSPALSAALLQRMLAAATRPGLGFFAVEEDGLFCGWMHLRSDRFEPAWAELGYRLQRRCWGRGLATTLGRELMDRAFGELNYSTVSARTVAENAASRRVMEKLGMHFAGDFSFPEGSLGGTSLPSLPGVLYLRHR